MIVTHRDCYENILNDFNKNQVIFVIIRGFKFLPEKADTDLDIIIHPSSWDKYNQVINGYQQNNLIKQLNSKEYVHHDKTHLVYHPFVTARTLKNGEKLPGKYYRFDVYKDLFFYANGENSDNKAMVPGLLFTNYMFQNKISKSNYWIPDHVSEVILLLFRNVFDKKGKWSEKHKKRIKELMDIVDKNELSKIVDMTFKNSTIVQNELLSGSYPIKLDTDPENLLFLIRKKGLLEDVVNTIQSKIENCFTINYKMLITIKDKQKLFKQFYQNYQEYMGDIDTENDNQCLMIIVKKNNNSHLSLKQEIRQLFKSRFPPMGNIIHCSDTVEDCQKELRLLLDDKNCSFKNIGTYYSTVKV